MSIPVLRALFDDAAIFPPASRPLAEALADHPHQPAELTGRLLVRATMLGDLVALGAADLEAGDLEAGDIAAGVLAIGVIADTGVAGIPETVEALRGLPPALRVETLEVALRPDGERVAEAAAATEAAHGLDARLFIELPRPIADGDAVIPLLVNAGAGAKLRTGGLAAEAFPSIGEVAWFITACVSAGVPFKCTAGLHNAVRRDEQHGFLNVVLATHAAIRGHAVEPMLAETSGERLAAHIRALDDADAADVRSALTAIGSCSITEPWDDLVALGLVAR